jgi:hypothetical protein
VHEKYTLQKLIFPFIDLSRYTVHKKKEDEDASSHDDDLLFCARLLLAAKLCSVQQGTRVYKGGCDCLEDVHCLSQKKTAFTILDLTCPSASLSSR